MPILLSKHAAPRRQAGALLLLALASISQVGAAALNLQQAIARTLQRNPDLAALELEIQAQDGVARQAGARPPTEVGLLVENALGSGERSGLDTAETTLSLGFLIEHGARARRIEVAAAGSELLATEMRLQRLDVAAEAARRFVVLLEKQQTLANAHDATRLAEQSVQAVRARVQAAKAPQAEEARAQAHLARARLDEEHAQHELATAGHRLAALWGASEVDFEQAEGDLLAAPAPAPYQQLRDRLGHNADFERLISEKRVREAEVRLAGVRSRPAWHVNAGIRRFEDTDDHAFVVGVTVPLPSASASRGAISEARARSALIDARSQALRARLDAELFALYQELVHAHTEVKTLRDEVLPRIEAALEQSHYAYERGRYGYVEWVAAQRELLDVRHALLRASSQLHQYRIELERLTGTALGVQASPREYP